MYGYQVYHSFYYIQSQSYYIYNDIKIITNLKKSTYIVHCSAELTKKQKNTRIKDITIVHLLILVLQNSTVSLITYKFNLYVVGYSRRVDVNLLKKFINQKRRGENFVYRNSRNCSACLLAFR